MQEGQEEALRGAGVSADAAARLASRLAAAEPDPAIDDLPGLAAAEGLLLRASVLAAGDRDLLVGALGPLLDAFDERDLSAATRGVLRHLTAVLRWRRDDDLGGALTALNRSVELLEREDDASGARVYAGRVHDTLGQLLHHRGQDRAARAAFERALVLKKAAGDEAGAALTEGNLGRLCLEDGEFRVAAKHLASDLAFIERHAPDLTRVRGQLETQLGLCALELADTSAAREHLDRARALADAGEDDVGRAFAAVYVGRLELDAEHFVAAGAELARGREALARLPGEAVPELRGLVEELEAEVALRAGRVADSLPLFEQADVHLARAGRLSPIDRARFLASWGRALEATGDRKGAVDRLRGALRALDAASATRLRADLEAELRALDESAWLLHGAGRFVGHQVIERLLHEGGCEGFRVREQDVTVLFSDIRGFTSVSEVLAPDELVALLNRYLESMTRCVEHHGGQVDKFIGDAVMAIFPLQEVERDASDRAVAAARYMQAELDRFNRELPEGLEPLKTGIGVHAGRVVAGVIGSPQKRSYTVIGDAVNTASRLEGMTKALDATVLITEAVRERLADADRWILVPLGAWRPKGRRQAVRVLALAGARGDGIRAELATQRAREAEEALARFRARAFDEAAEAFRSLATRALPGEGARAFQRLAEAAQAYRETPPKTNWDAAIELLEK